MTEAIESNQSSPESQNINFAELRAKLAQIKEAGADPHFADIDIGLLTDEDLEIYDRLLKKMLKEEDLNAWRSRVMEETKSLQQPDNPMKLPDRGNFVAFIANKLSIQNLLGQRNNWVK